MGKLRLKRAVIRRLKKVLPEPLAEQIERIQIGLHSFTKHSPILVYQMGKVGSLTVCRSLRRAKLPNPVYHLHFLTQENLEWEEKRFEGARRRGVANAGTLRHVRTGWYVRKKINDNRRKNITWQIVTGVREPISWTVSSFFQTAKHFHPELLDENGYIRVADAIRFLQERLNGFDEKTDFVCTWFDRELKRIFQVDVFDAPFNHANGYVIIEKPQVRVLVLRQEDMSRNFEKAINQFISPSRPILVENVNVGSEKEYHQEYKYTRTNLRLPPSVCERIYSSRFVRHFYTEEMICGFMKMWVGI